MRQFNKLIETHFNFLEHYGYICTQEYSEENVRFIGESNQIDITFSTVGYELTCQFADVDKNTFSLQDGLDYVKIKEFKGVYQVPRKEEIERGIIYLADALNCFFEKICVLDTANFQKIYQYRLDMQKKLLKDYYFKIDMNKAEEYWRNGEYSKAKELYENHEGGLSKLQTKRLEYIRKN